MLWVFRLCLLDICSLGIKCLQKCQVMVTSFGCCQAGGREPPRVPTTGDPAKCGERWGRVTWKMTGVWLWRWVEPGWDGELHEEGY